MTQKNHLSEGDLAAIERIICKNADDIAVSIARSFERIEERIDAAESRTYSRLADVEDHIQAAKIALDESIAEVKEALKE